MDRYDWIIGISNSSTDGVILLRFYGSKNEVKEKLMFLINEDRKRDKELWDFGCKSVDDITSDSDELGYEFYGYGCYTDYHIDYTAKKFSYVEMI